MEGPLLWRPVRRRSATWSISTVLFQPGGRVLLIAYGNPAAFEALHVFISAAQAVVPEFEGPADDEPLLEFQVPTPTSCGNGWSTQA